MDFQHDPRVYRVLRDYSDLMTIQFQTPNPLIMHRHKTSKTVYLIATKYYLYLFKKKGMKLYTRWPVRMLSVATHAKLLFISSGLNAKDSISEYKLQAGAKRSGKTSDDEDEDADNNEETLVACHFEVDAQTTNIDKIEVQLQALILQAKSLQMQHEREEEGIIRVRKVKIKEGGDSYEEEFDEEQEEGDEETGSEIEEDEDEAQQRNKRLKARRAAGMQQQKGPAPPTAARVASSAGRHLTISSLVDGEFADYSALKNAYLRREDGSLLDGLANFIADNEAQVHVLCRDHCGRFLNAARQCRTISNDDATLVKEELGGAGFLVRKSALEMTQAATALFLSNSVRTKLESAQQLVGRMRVLVEYLEAAESHVHLQQLVPAVRSCDKAAQLATPLAEYALGEYVLHHRVPQLREAINSAALSTANNWMRLLREEAVNIGRVALASHTGGGLGHFTRNLVIADGGDEWWVEEVYVRSTVAAANSVLASVAPVLNNVCSGAFIQRVFTASGRGHEFARHYTHSRQQQHACDLFPENISTSTLAALQSYCAVAVGVVLIEDMVQHVTKPQVTSKAELLTLWGRISNRLARESEVIAMTLCMSGSIEDVKGVFRLLTQVVGVIEDAVRTVELSPVVLTRVLERTSNQLHSVWLQQTCLDVEQLVVTDSLAPVTIKDQGEFQAYVVRFLLNKCPSLKLPVANAYKSGTIYLPYALFVPMIGDKTMWFLDSCFGVAASANGRQSEVNNTDAMITEYLCVIFRKANSILLTTIQNRIPAQAVLQFAVLTTSCVAMQVVLTAVEQRFILQWDGDYSDKQIISKPKLLQSCAKLFASTVTVCIGKMQDGVQLKLTEILKQSEPLSYWKGRVAGRSKSATATTPSSAGAAAPEASAATEGTTDALKAAVDLLCKTVQSLTQLLQPDIVQMLSRMSLIFLVQEVQDKLAAAVRGSTDRDVATLRLCVAEADSSIAASLAGDACKRLDAIVGGSFHKVASDDCVQTLRAYLDKKELEFAEQHRLEQAAAAAANAAAAVMGGVMDVGKMTKRGIFSMGNAVKSTVVDAKNAVVGGKH